MKQKTSVSKATKLLVGTLLVIFVVGLSAFIVLNLRSSKSTPNKSAPKPNCLSVYQPVCCKTATSDGEIKSTMSNSCVCEQINKGVVLYAGTCQTAYFEFSDNTNFFVFKLEDPVKIKKARAMISGEIPKLHVMGYVGQWKVDYNPIWSYHLLPDSIDFFENAIEVCDASISYLEKYHTEFCAQFPKSKCHWCPWNSNITREIISDKLTN